MEHRIGQYKLLNNLYKQFFYSTKDAVGEGVSDCAYYVAETALQYGLDSTPYSEIYKEKVTSKFEQANTFAELSDVSEQAGQVFQDLLEQIKRDANK